MLQPVRMRLLLMRSTVAIWRVISAPSRQTHDATIGAKAFGMRMLSTRNSCADCWRAAEGWRLAIDPIAIRGQRLALSRHTYRDTDEADEPIAVEALVLTEVDEAQLLYHAVVFDTDDLDDAFAELDSRYAAGEAAPHAHTWSLVTKTYAGFNRRELFGPAPNWESVDHRRGITSAQFDAIDYVHASWDVTPDVEAYVQAVHRLSDLGTVVTVRAYGASRDGFKAEWVDVHLVTFEGDLPNRFELFDEADLDAALARFDELDRP